MRVSALEFRVADRFFAVEMAKVRHFFEIEEVLKLDFLPEFVLGVVKYNKHVYPLISLKKAWNLGEDSNDEVAVAIVFKNKEYAVLIDEIVKIEELDKKENFLLEVFEENGKLIGNLNLDFLEEYNIPTFKNRIEKITERKDLNKESFLLFKCNEEILAIETSVIKKVEDYEKDTIIINGMVVNLTPFEKLYRGCEKKNVLVLESEKVLAIPIGSIIDIHLVDKDDITVANDGVVNKYFLYKSHEVKVFSTNYLKKLTDRYGVLVKRDKTHKFDEKIEVLLLNICGEKFAIRMSNVLDISEYDEASLNFANNNPHVKGIVTTKEGATYILSFEKILNKEHTITEDSKIIVLKDQKKHLKAILVDSIDDIVYTKNENIVVSNDNDGIVGGMVITNKEMVPLINMEWPKEF